MGQLRLAGALCVTALQQSVTQLKSEQQGHLMQLDTLMRENGRLKEAQEHGAAMGESLWHQGVPLCLTITQADCRHAATSMQHVHSSLCFAAALRRFVTIGPTLAETCESCSSFQCCAEHHMLLTHNPLICMPLV